ncbi:MAG: hypothetical protein V1859_10680 [archaeon]
MIKISELKELEDSFFAAKLSYYKPSLYSLIEANFSENIPFSQNSLLKIPAIVPEESNKAYVKILSHDFKEILSCIKKIPKEFDENIWEGEIPKIRLEIKKILGLDFKTRAVFFKEQFPIGLSLFEQKGASSVTVFEGQKDSGIYFLNKRVSSLFSPILLIHEQLHSCLSQNKTKDQTYIEWFEEGLCLFFSALIYFNLTKNLEVIKQFRERNYIFSQVKPEYHFSKRYFEYMKIFSRLYLHGGPKLIGKILLIYLTNDRKKVNKYLDLDKLTIKYRPKNEIENLLVNYTNIIEPEKITPLEYLILSVVVKPKTIKTISMLTDAPPDVIERALVKMQIKGLIVAKNEFIEINWRKQDLFDHGLIRPVYPL